MRAQLVLKFAICAVLIAITWVVFGQTLGHEFVNFDDPFYVSENPQIEAGLNWQNILWAFTHVHSNNWHPLSFQQLASAHNSVAHAGQPVLRG